MRKLILRVVVAVGLVGLGWSIGKAQVPEPDFEIVVDAPVGPTTVTCKRGCSLAWVERGVPSSTDTRKPVFDFNCSGPNVQRCSSYRVGGWISK
jgi:hypothetical protein